MPLPRWSLIAVAAVTLTVVCPVAVASYPPPRWSFQKPTSNGKYVFVHIGEVDRAAIGGFLEPAEAREIRRVYPQSGLYLNDGSTVPLWTFEGYLDRGEVHVANDGVHMVLSGWHATSSATVALAFYAEGKAVRRYSVGELVDDWDDLETVSKEARPGSSKVTFIQEAGFNEGTSDFTLLTKDGNRFVFDVRNGEIVSASRRDRSSWPRVLWIAGVVAGLVVVSLSIRWLRRRTRGPFARRSIEAVPNPFDKGRG